MERCRSQNVVWHSNPVLLVKHNAALAGNPVVDVDLGLGLEPELERSSHVGSRPVFRTSVDVWLVTATHMVHHIGQPGVPSVEAGEYSPYQSWTEEWELHRMVGIHVRQAKVLERSMLFRGQDVVRQIQ